MVCVVIWMVFVVRLAMIFVARLMVFVTRLMVFVARLVMIFVLYVGVGRARCLNNKGEEGRSGAD